MATFTERIQLLLTSDASDAIAGLRSTGLASKDLDGKLKSSQAAMGKLGAVTGLTANEMKFAMGAAAATAGVAVAKFAFDAANDYANLAGKVRDFGRASGASATDSSRMVAVLDDMQISADKGATAMFRLGRNVSDGGGALRQFGVQVATNKDGTTDLVGTLLNVSDAYTRIKDPAERAALVQAAFGRGGKDMIPILEQGRQGLEKFFESADKNHQLFTQQDLDQARQYELALDSLNDTLTGLKREAGAAVMPTLTATMQTTADIITIADEAAGKFGTTLGEAGAFAERLINPIAGAGHAVKELVGIFSGGGDESDKFTESQKRLQDAQREVARLAADSTTPHKDLAAAKRDLRAADEEYQGVVGRVSDALQNNTNKIQENLTKAQEWANAQLGVTGAQLNVEAATNRYTDALANHEAGSIEVRQAAQNLEQQFVNLGNATYAAAIQGKKSVSEASAEQINALKFVAGTLAPDSPLRVWLEQYIARLGAVPPKIPTEVTVTGASEAEAALRRVAAWIDYLNNNPNPSPNFDPNYGPTGIYGAEGAIVNRPTIALIGEAGPEALIPLNKVPGNSPLPNMQLNPPASPVAYEHSRALGTLMIPVQIDGRVVTEIVVSNLNRAGGPKITQRAVV